MTPVSNYQSYSESELLHLITNDDAFSFTELYNRFWKTLFAIAYNRLKDTQAAEDIVHDVFASLWNNRKKIEVISLENYLAAATKYMVLAHIKKIEYNRRYQQSQQQAPVFEITIENSLHNKRLLEFVKKEVEKLPEKCRLIFKYSRENGMKVKDIAQQLQISPKTVENQLNKALRQLRVAMKMFLHSILFILFVIN